MEYGFIEWINLRENTYKHGLLDRGHNAPQKKQEFVDAVYDIYKNNPKLSDEEIAKILTQNNPNRRGTAGIRTPGILWTFRGIPELIKKAIAENPNLDDEAIESLVQQTDKNVLTWMIDAVRTNARRATLYPEPTGTTPVTPPVAKPRKPRIPEPTGTPPVAKPRIPEPKPFTYSDFGGRNPFSYDEPTRFSHDEPTRVAFGYGTGGGKRIFRKPPN